MKTTINTVNLTANSKTANILAGNINEFVATRSRVQLACISSASGVKLTFLAGSDVGIDDAEILNIGTALVYPDSVIDTYLVGPGTRMLLTLRETAGVSTTDILTSVDVQPY
jgi:hypothetical protein